MNLNCYEVPCPAQCRTGSHEVTVPGSKSITNRALLLAAMAEGTSTLHGCLTSDDARHFLTCLKTLGFPVCETPDGALGSDITITGFGGAIPAKQAEIYVGSAGTAARFLVAMLAFSDGTYTVDASEQMKKRPMQPLIDALREAGAEVACLENEGHFPLRITGAGDAVPERISVNIDQSSQFLSALLIAAGTRQQPMEIHVTGRHGLSYVDLTADMMRDFGVTAEKSEQGGTIVYKLAGTAQYHAVDDPIEPDMSAAAYFYAAAALLGITVCVKGVTDRMRQGDTAFLNVLAQMGCTVKTGARTTVTGPADGVLRGGFTVDMSAFSDQALTLAAIAPYADAPITIKGIAHIRLQECDRIRAITENLAALGIRAEAGEDSVTIHPRQPLGCEIETFEDHRVAMSFALTGLRTKGVRILNPACCAKTFAEYFDVLEALLRAL